MAGGPVQQKAIKISPACGVVALATAVDLFDDDGVQRRATQMETHNLAITAPQGLQWLLWLGKWCSGDGGSLADYCRWGG